MIALSGVRSSWLMLARKSLFAWLARVQRVDGVAELGGQPPLRGDDRLPLGEDAGLAAERGEQPQVVVAEQAAVPVEQQHRALGVRRHRHAQHGHEVVAEVVAVVRDQRRVALAQPGGRPARISAVRSAKPSSSGVGIGGPAYAAGASRPSARGISTATASAPVCTRMISA